VGKKSNIAHETAICRKPHNLSNWDSHHYQTVALQTHLLLSKCHSHQREREREREREEKRKVFSSCFRVGILRIGLFFFLISCTTVCRCITTYCCLTNDMYFWHYSVTTQMKLFLSAHVQVNKTGVPRLHPTDFHL
jgi:hypothetical protein